jgi:hypothetical protein
MLDVEKTFFDKEICGNLVIIRDKLVAFTYMERSFKVLTDFPCKVTIISKKAEQFKMADFEFSSVLLVVFRSKKRYKTYLFVNM